MYGFGRGVFRVTRGFLEGNTPPLCRDLAVESLGLAVGSLGLAVVFFRVTPPNYVGKRAVDSLGLAR